MVLVYCGKNLKAERHIFRPKKSGMSKREKERWAEGERLRVSAIQNNQRFTKSIIEDCQIPDRVSRYYNSSLPPEVEKTYIPVGMSEPSVLKRRDDRSIRRTEETETIPSSSSQASDTAEEFQWIKVKKLALEELLWTTLAHRRKTLGCHSVVSCVLEGIEGRYKGPSQTLALKSKSGASA
ncbi:hypothetical protein FHG87_019026 [Trinorchestia longiramus]|nr:hypothetical protein FHG87_019026 [Trinorchestia longiramus]